ncbi:MAG TPA: Clp protease N-terminal domain-containing protein [Acidimicrobiales bacterium]|nr:Clp protease N-terminal domain-containing protein [Acidimicrobiales bacterium]
MFERFTDRARRIVVLAQEESRALDHNYIGTEHILLGLLRVGEGPAYAALAAEGVELDAARAKVLEHVGRGEGPPGHHIPFTPRAKKVLELSLREALQLADNFIGTEHILLGLLREGEGLACQIMVELGADLPAVRARLMTVIGRSAMMPPEVTRLGRAGRVWQSLTAPLRSGPTLPGPSPDQTPVLRRFSPAAWRVTLLAQSEALRLGGSAAGEEHLILGLLAEEGRGARALAAAAGITPEEARARIDTLVGPPEGVEPRPVEPRFSRTGLDVIEFSLVEAVARGRNGIDTDDLLLGVVRQAETTDGVARAALRVFETSADALRAAVAALGDD